MFRRSIVLIAVIACALPACGGVVFVDNSKPAGGDGSAQRPLTSIAAAASMGDVIYVAETATPYLESVSLRSGQVLIGSAYGLEALRAEKRIDLGETPVAAIQGPGPTIAGTISVSGNNIIAGCTIVAERITGIVSSGSSGPISIRNVYLRPSKGGFGIFLQQHSGPVEIVGGGLESVGDGSGLTLIGGSGDVTIDRFPITGSFATAIRISGRSSGAVLFRAGSKIRIDDAMQDAVVLENMPAAASVRFEQSLQIRGRRRGFVATGVRRVLVMGGGSSISTANAAALDVRQSGGELTFQSVSAENVTEGVVIDSVHARVTITGEEGKPGSGGTIRGARAYGIRVEQSRDVHLANMTIADSGSNLPIKGAKCAGEFDRNTSVVCHAALFLRHITSSSFENMAVEGGGAVGVNANNIRDVTFSGLTVRRASGESFEAGVLLQEIIGTILFRLCEFADNAGGELMIAQRFNSGRLTLDRCTVSAAERPATELLQMQVGGFAHLDVELNGARMHDNTGAGIRATASEHASLSLAIADLYTSNVGGTALEVTAQQSSRGALLLRGAYFAPSSVPLVAVEAADSAEVCADFAGNHFPEDVPNPIRLVSRSATGRLKVVTSGQSADSAVIAKAMTEGSGKIETISGCR